MRKILLALLLMASLPAVAQQPIRQSPLTTAPATATIAATGTFQIPAGLLFSNTRQGGFLQNNGTAGFMFVYFAGSATNCTNATTDKSVQLQPATTSSQGGSVVLSNGLQVLQDTICVTGTIGDKLSYGVN